MTDYVLITPEIEDSEATTRKIGKTFLANAIVEKLRAEHKVVLHIDESQFDTDLVTKNITEDTLKHKLIQRKMYDYVVIAGLTNDVESAFKILRRVYFPTTTKTIKLQCLS